MTGGFLEWEGDGAGGARLLRAYGETPEAVLPEEVGGLPLREIGDYCFSPGDSWRAAGGKAGGDGHSFSPRKADPSLRELCGDYLRRAVLPDSASTLGRSAFYNCTRLEEVEIGSGLIEIGSDAFMNCKGLRRIILRGGLSRGSGIRKILGQISSDLEVLYVEGGRVAAAALYPDYYESYDEIAPAHIFGRNIEGEGFRARQCFRDGMPDFEQYDSIFAKARAEEREGTLCKMAMDRLLYPRDLRPAAREQYEAYALEHAEFIAKSAVEERDEGQIRLLAALGMPGGDGNAHAICVAQRDANGARKALSSCAAMAARAGWARGVALCTRLSGEMGEGGGSRYGFDPF